MIGALRYGLPAVLIVAGFVLLFTVDGSLRWEGWAMSVGSGLAILLMNVLFRYGSRGDREREQEVAAREFYAEHGRWPDEPSR
jgi:high-affinity Fe2+/Pb2+ permease